ncbi:MAG: YfiR family protein [Chitinophagales bacterium]
MKLFTINLLLFIFCFTAVAQTETEHESKAKHIYQLTKYVDWNPVAEEMFIGILGDTPITPFLKTQADANDNVTVLQYNSVAELLEGNACHILFVPSSFDISTADLAKVNPQQTLTLGEAEDFLEKGGLIKFIITRNALKFEIDQNHLLNCKFKIKPKLLKMAELVKNTDYSRVACEQL